MKKLLKVIAVTIGYLVLAGVDIIKLDDLVDDSYITE